ncbi:MAG: extracellular solute-binding protein [Lachnospiraceae bacterium]|nr:extracellular solute-binding protein [Lachnospiraceae bacterium]
MHKKNKGKMIWKRGGNFLRYGILLMVLVLMAGCGKIPTEETELQNPELTDFVYVPEFTELNLNEDAEGDRMLLSDVKLVGENVLYNLRVWKNGEQAAKTHIFVRESEDFDKKTELPQDIIPQGENEYVSLCSCDGDGNFYMAWQRLGEKSYDTTDFLSKYDKDYNLVYTKELTDIWVNDLNSGIWKMWVDDNGRLYGCSQNIMYVFDANGELEKSIKLGTSQMSGLMIGDDGRVYIDYMDKGSDGGYELKLAELNIEEGKREEPIDGLPYGCTEAWAGRENKILLNRTGSLWEFDLETKEAKVLFDWTDMYVNSDRIKSLYMTGQGEIIILVNTDNSNPLIPQYGLIYLSKVSPSQVVQREVITLATLYQSDEYLMDAVAKFNRENNRYLVEIKGYFDEGTKYTPEGYEDALTRFHADLVSGQAGDIINLKNMDWRNLARKGALEELTPYMSQDLRKEDFVDSVVKAYEVDDRCYTIPKGFVIETIMGKASVVGSRAQWDVDTIKKLEEEYPEASLMHMGNSYMLLMYCMQYGGVTFIDYETGECHFESQDFTDILELCKRAGAQKNQNFDLYSNVKMDRVLFSQVSIYNVTQWQMYRQLFCEEGVSVGFPSQGDGGRVCLTGEEMLAIAANSKNKEGAWAFWKSFMKQELGSEWMLPSYADYFEKVIEEAGKIEYKYDEDGNEVEKAKGTWSQGSFETTIYAATEEEIATFMELLEHVASGQLEDQMWEIIGEEAGAYFEGQKTASEVAGIIQNRVQLYLFENEE